MTAILKGLGLGLLKAFGFSFALKFGYKIYGRPQLRKLLDKVDPNDEHSIDEEALDKVDEVFDKL